MSALISAAELRGILQQPNVRVLDASYNDLPLSFEGIPGAQNFDIDDVADPQAPLPHTIPTAEIFSKKVRAMGIGNNDLVIVYDTKGMALAAARAWWMFRLFGHDNVKILDGGLPAWTKAGYALGAKATKPSAPASFKATFRPELVSLRNQIEDNIKTRTVTLLDARDGRRYRGEVPEARPNVQPGHIPSSLSLPYADLLNPDGTLKPKDQLEKTFKTANIPLKGPLASTCGSGVTACVVALALYELGHQDVAVYDGSWTEWGSDPALPKAKGASA